MKRMTKGWLAWSVIGMLLLAGGQVFATGAGSAEDPAPAMEEEEFGPVEITFWYALSGNLGESVVALVDRFNAENENVTVMAEYAGAYADALNKLILAVQSNEAPNVVQTYDIGTRTMLDSNAVLPLEDLQNEFPSVEVNLDDFVEAAINYYTFDGKVFALPFAQSSPILYYNKDRFREVGLDPDNPPETYAEFMDAAAKLTDPSSDGRKVGASWAIRSWLVEQAIALQDSLIFNNGNGREARATEIFIDQEPTKNFISMWAEMEQSGYYLNPGRSWGDARNNFISGISAMMLQSTAALATTIAGVGDNFEMGTGLLPRPAGADGGVIISGNALWAIDGHPRAENRGTVEFLAWLAQPPQQVEWHKATGYYPLRVTTIETLRESGYYDDNPPYYTAIRQLLESSPTPASAGGVAGPFPEIRDRVESAIEDILANDTDVDQTLDVLANDVEAVLERYNRLYGE